MIGSSTTPGTNQTDTDPAWSPDGSKVAFVRLGHAPDSSVTSTQAYVVDRDGTNERQLAVLPVESVQPFDRLFHPTWSADGLHLAYSGGGGALRSQCGWHWLPSAQHPIYPTGAVAALKVHRPTWLHTSGGRRPQPRRARHPRTRQA